MMHNWAVEAERVMSGRYLDSYNQDSLYQSETYFTCRGLYFDLIKWNNKLVAEQL